MFSCSWEICEFCDLKKNSQIVPIFSVSVMEKEETKDAKAEEAEGKGQQQEQQEGFVLCFC